MSWHSDDCSALRTVLRRQQRVLMFVNDSSLGLFYLAGLAVRRLRRQASRRAMAKGAEFAPMLAAAFNSDVFRCRGRPMAGRNGTQLFGDNSSTAGFRSYVP